jgi:hypothetical protein
VTDKQTDGRTIHQRLRFPCHLPNLVAIHKRKEPNLNSPLLHVIMESRQFSRILLCFGKTFKKENPPQCLNMATSMLFSSKCGELKRHLKGILPHY